MKRKKYIGYFEYIDFTENLVKFELSTNCFGFIQALICLNAIIISEARSGTLTKIHCEDDNTSKKVKDFAEFSKMFEE